MPLKALAGTSLIRFGVTPWHRGDCGQRADPINGRLSSMQWWVAAQSTEAELVQIAEYLSSHFGPNRVVTGISTRGDRPGSEAPRVTGRGPGPLGAGAADSHVVDDAGAERGKSVYIAECITCHGVKARGGDSSLLRNHLSERFQGCVHTRIFCRGSKCTSPSPMISAV